MCVLSPTASGALESAEVTLSGEPWWDMSTQPYAKRARVAFADHPRRAGLSTFIGSMDQIPQQHLWHTLQYRCNGGCVSVRHAQLRVAPLQAWDAPQLHSSGIDYLMRLVLGGR